MCRFTGSHHKYHGIFQLLEAYGRTITVDRLTCWAIISVELARADIFHTQQQQSRQDMVGRFDWFIR